MGPIEDRMQELGISLPAVFAAPGGMAMSFALVRVHGDLAYISGHGPIDGASALMRGKVGGKLTLEQGYQAARATGLSILASLQAELGDLERVGSWVKALGLVNAAPGFNGMPA